MPLQNAGNPQEGFQAGISDFALNEADHGAGQSGARRQDGHGQATFFPFFPQNAGDLGTNLVQVAG